MNSSALKIIVMSFLLGSGIANAGDNTDLMTDMSAKLAQMKARMRAYQADMETDNADPYALSVLDSAGCDINIGNVVVDDTSESPDEVTVLIDGDIIQSNNCR